MGAYYDEVEIEDMVWDASRKLYHYPCPCGDRFEITRQQLQDCEDIATCPSCSLIIRVIYDPLDFEDDEDDEGEGEDTVSDSSDDEKLVDTMKKLSV
ncbi:zf-CSL-domain-containing protein [Lentinula boryana]|uniref:Diphthamide biosynthesis protein 3 n=1 Tax=Lentinula boryana TaxID=40481 RepID=A0ABQ8QQY5_9AGAR|nr:zf-CSL-domain-containing protein [Lentinula boryana]